MNSQVPTMAWRIIPLVIFLRICTGSLDRGSGNGFVRRD